MRSFAGAARGSGGGRRTAARRREAARLGCGDRRAELRGAAAPRAGSRRAPARGEEDDDDAERVGRDAAECRGRDVEERRTERRRIDDDVDLGGRHRRGEARDTEAIGELVGRECRAFTLTKPTPFGASAACRQGRRADRLRHPRVDAVRHHEVECALGRPFVTFGGAMRWPAAIASAARSKPTKRASGM